jgi:hypothetical protein
MTPFSTLSQGIQQALSALDVAAGVSLVQDDAQDLVTEVTKAYDQTGMMILLGTPEFKNEDKLADVVNAIISVEILVREVPTLWRNNGTANTIHCADLGQAIAPALQGLYIPGFEKLRVLTGESLGKALGEREGQEPLIFQDYLLVIQTMQIFSPE